MTRSLYRSLLWLHPPGFRGQFADEMLWIYDETAAAGVFALFADGLASLARQWLMSYQTWTLAAAGLGGALHSALFLLMTLPMVQLPAVHFVPRRMPANVSAEAALSGFDGIWKGSLRSTGPSGPIELILARGDSGWMGELFIPGPDGQMHGGPLEDVRLQGDFLRFRVRAADADMVFSGSLRYGRMSGTLEAVATGKYAASSPRGRRIGNGTWFLIPAGTQHS